MRSNDMDFVASTRPSDTHRALPPEYPFKKALRLLAMSGEGKVVLVFSARAGRCCEIGKSRVRLQEAAVLLNL